MGDVSLIVVHDDDRVELPSLHLGEYRVRRERPFHKDALCSCGNHGRGALLIIFRPEQAALAAMRVEAGHGQARRPPAKPPHGLMGQFDRPSSTLSLRTASQALRRDTWVDTCTTLKSLSTSIIA